MGSWRGMATYFGFVLLAAFGVAMGAATLNCPRCQKMGSAVCRHCGNEQLTAERTPKGDGKRREGETDVIHTERLLGRPLTPEGRLALESAETRVERKARKLVEKEDRAEKQAARVAYEEQPKPILAERMAARRAGRVRRPETAAKLRNAVLAGTVTFLATLAFALAVGGSPAVAFVGLTGLLLAALAVSAMLSYRVNTRS